MAFSGDWRSGDESNCFGVLSKSARVPNSPSSSRHRTARFEDESDLRLTGVKVTPLLADETTFRRRGEAFIGDDSCVCSCSWY